MDSSLIFIAVIAIVLLITYCACHPFSTNNSSQNTNSNSLEDTVEKFTSCPDNKRRPRPKVYPDYKVLQEERDGVKYGEDEDINYHLTNPLVPRTLKYPRERSSWKTFWKQNFMPGQVKRDTNFEGTQIRNYLDSMDYFHN